ncbi:hypothetical protein HY642_02690 [Candidatus Woesearchaeota archaeon]|nr:hypothetical protein [Candidatus Woesearchaeota archaeon]
MHVFAVRDKSGRIIHLSRERWAHVQKHPEMSGSVERVKDTLQRPDTILRFEGAVHFYFKHYKDKQQFMFVSARYLNGEGFVITSYYTDTIR